MIKVPEKERLREIENCIPGWISIFRDGKGGLGKKMLATSQLFKLAKEFNITLPLGGSNVMDLIKKLGEKNKIPDFVVLLDEDGKYHISFGDDQENDPIIASTRDFYDVCTNGVLYIYSSVETSRRALKCMRRCAIGSYMELKTGKAYCL